MFQLTVNALLIDFLVALVLGAGWTLGCALMAWVIGLTRKPQ
jgi:hypothetical protein